LLADGETTVGRQATPEVRATQIFRTIAGAAADTDNAPTTVLERSLDANKEYAPAKELLAKLKK